MNSIPSSLIWLESSLEESFNANESDDDSDLSSWQDVKNSSTFKKNNGVSSSERPKYSSNNINGIHAVKFSGSDDSYFTIDGSELNNSNYTIVVLEKRQGAGENYFLTSAGSSTSDNEMLKLGYSASGTVIHSQGAGNNYTSSVSSYNSSDQQPKIFTFVQSSTEGKKTYINGFLAAQDSDIGNLTNIGDLRLGNGYTGEIGEFMMFSRALKKEEIISIGQYLVQKWRMSNVVTSRAISGSGNPSSTEDQSCTSGMVANSGCMNSCVVNIVGESDTSLAEGESEDFDCDQVGYADTISSQTCSGGTAITGTCGCDTASGYSLVGGVCAQTCSVSTINGTSQSGLSVSEGTQVTCDEDGYNDAVLGTCSGGTTITGTCGCATGYSGSTCSSCDTANGYNMIGGTCQIGCSVPDTSGITGRFVAVSSTSTECDAAGYQGDLLYTCSSGGVLNITAECVREDIGLIYLIVGGGGAGGSGTGGGGGGGGVITGTLSYTSGLSTNIVVGSGGIASSSSSSSNNGGNSSAFGLTAIGGGSGGFNLMEPYIGSDGGSGGGGSNVSSGGSGTSGQGSNGGASTEWFGQYGCGGGGGYSSAGQDGNSSVAGDGGSGYYFVINNKYYAGGGGGGGYSISISNVGQGGSGVGGTPTGSTSTASAVANSGSGGGGAINNANNAGNGSSGVVIIAYRGSQRGTGGTISTATHAGNSYTIHTFTTNGTFDGN